MNAFWGAPEGEKYTCRTFMGQVNRMTDLTSNPYHSYELDFHLSEAFSEDS